MPDDVILNKAAIIERCVDRVREVHGGDDRNLTDDLTRQESIVLNILRACEASIDLAMHLVNSRRLGLPQDSREAFTMLADDRLLDRELAGRLGRMVGFRNLAVRDFRRLDIAIVRAIIKGDLGDLLEVASLALKLESASHQ
jgi:uncharacterized protein YutE (UPF0331/DUF86 family)